MSKISRRKASTDEKSLSQDWELWESGETSRFEYHYDKDVHFVVQQGSAVIFSQHNQPVSIEPGDHVTIEKGVEGIWEISSPIVNRYEYLS